MCREVTAPSFCSKSKNLQHCSMRFADGSNLRRHIQTHTNEKPHACKQCGKAFARGSILKEHMRTHAKYDNAAREQSQNRSSGIGCSLHTQEVGFCAGNFSFFLLLKLIEGITLKYWCYFDKSQEAKYAFSQKRHRAISYFCYE